MIPGEIIPGDEPVELNPGRERTTITVLNGADRPVQVGSHFHFAAVNPGLDHGVVRLAVLRDERGDRA